MPRGGARPGAGRKPKNRGDAPGAKPAATKTGHSPAGKKLPGTPAGWPFGTEEPAAPAPAPAEPPAAPEVSALSPLDYLLSVVRDVGADEKTRLQAAAIAAPFVHAKPAPIGKKEQRQEDAKKVGSKFAASAPPKLAAANGKRI
jgi:phage terminase small subunit